MERSTGKRPSRLRSRSTSDPRVTLADCGPCNPLPIRVLSAARGAVAQLGERSVRNAEVEGSIPFGSTSFSSKQGFEEKLSRRSQRRSRTTTVHAIYGVHRMATFHYVYILTSERDPIATTPAAPATSRKDSTPTIQANSHTPRNTNRGTLNWPSHFARRKKPQDSSATSRAHSGRAFASKHF